MDSVWGQGLVCTRGRGDDESPGDGINWFALVRCILEVRQLKNVRNAGRRAEGS